jgi:hypothetical protein
MKVIQNFVNKSLSQCTQYLMCLYNPYDGDISTKYVLHYFLKIEMSFKYQIEGKKIKHLSLFLGCTSTP